MASVTAEVLLHFGVGIEETEFVKSIDTLRFDHGIEDSKTIIEILTSAYRMGYDYALSDS